jgi:hypothetical protein
MSAAFLTASKISSMLSSTAARNSGELAQRPPAFISVGEFGRKRSELMSSRNVSAVAGNVRGRIVERVRLRDRRLRRAQKGPPRPSVHAPCFVLRQIALSSTFMAFSVMPFDDIKFPPLILSLEKYR